KTTLIPLRAALFFLPLHHQQTARHGQTQRKNSDYFEHKNLLQLLLSALGPTATAGQQMKECTFNATLNSDFIYLIKMEFIKTENSGSGEKHHYMADSIVSTRAMSCSMRMRRHSSSASG